MKRIWIAAIGVITYITVFAVAHTVEQHHGHHALTCWIVETPYAIIGAVGLFGLATWLYLGSRGRTGFDSDADRPE